LGGTAAAAGLKLMSSPLSSLPPSLPQPALPLAAPRLPQFGALATFSMEQGIVNRERASKSYHVLPYYLARFICDMPLRVGQGLLFGGWPGC
jgi:hypothetical protein